MPLLLKNATYIHPFNLSFHACHIVVGDSSKGNISFIPLDKIIPDEKYDNILDCTGLYVTKSFAVGHHHAYSALARGMPPPDIPPRNFHEKLRKIWWKLDMALDENSIRASALATALHCARDGSTMVIDHHSSPKLIGGSLDIIAEAFEETGLSHLLCYEITDRNGKGGSRAGLEETRRYLSAKQGLIGLHASFTVDNNTLDAAAELMHETGSGIHIHVAEDPVDQEITRLEHGMSVAERLHQSGVLESPASILVHCLHLSEKERTLIAESKAWIAENMESNLNNRVGLFDSSGLGERIMLGTDGMHSDMIRSAQYAWFAAKKETGESLEKIYKRMRNVHRYLELNQFEGDGPNNLVVFDYDGPTDLEAHNFLGHFFYGFHGGHVCHVISQGKLIVKERQILCIDEAEVLHYCRDQAKKLWKKL